VLAYPASIFYSAYYTEGLFLLAVAGCFYFFEQEKLLPAGLFGGLAALTRGAGIVLFPALLFGTLERRSWREPLTPRLLWLLLIPASLGIFMVTLSVSVGDPLAFMKEESNFGCSPTLPWNTIVAAVRHFNPGNIMECLDLLATALLLLVAAISVRTLGWAHGIFALGVVALPLFAGRVRSMERYSACVVPLFLVLAAATRRPWPARLVFLAFAAFMVLQTVLFANWYWAG
jgi:hypothetical protein